MSKGSSFKLDPMDLMTDPVSRMGRQLIDNLLRKELRSFISEELIEMTSKNTVGNQYYLEAFFIPFFNKSLLKPLVREIA